MSTDAELTFIRCPSCRSLMPAVATRCRMCGHVVESQPGTPEADHSEKVEKKSRVRQRTVTVPENFLEDVKESSEPMSPQSEETTEQAFRLGRQEGRFNREKRTQHVFQSGVFPQEKNNEQTPFTEKQKEHEAAREEEDTESFDEKISLESLDREEFDELNPEKESEPRKRRRRRRKRKHNREGGGQMTSADSFQSEPQSQKLLVDNKHSEESARRLPRGTEEVTSDQFLGGTPSIKSPEPFPKQHPWKTQGLSKQRDDDDTTMAKPEQWQRGGSPMESQVMSERTPAHDLSYTNAPLERADEGRLMGWLVEYGSNPKGEARELRTGGFFIGAEQLRPTDLIIAHDSLSTPHCLVKGNLSGGLEIQDLMSEKGTFVKKKGEQSWQKVEHALVQHGDRIRLGNYEVIVCLVSTS